MRFVMATCNPLESRASLNIDEVAKPTLGEYLFPVMGPLHYWRRIRNFHGKVPNEEFRELYISSLGKDLKLALVQGLELSVPVATTLSYFLR
jgi:hypothetical protein